VYGVTGTETRVRSDGYLVEARHEEKQGQLVGHGAAQDGGEHDHVHHQANQLQDLLEDGVVLLELPLGHLEDVVRPPEDRYTSNDQTDTWKMSYGRLKIVIPVMSEQTLGRCRTDA